MIEIKLILCPVDFSEFSIRAYRHALSLAEHYRAKLVAQHIVEVWRHPSASFAVTANLYDEYCQLLRGNGKEQLEELVKKHTYNEIQPELVVDEGTAGDVILSLAQERGTDLIVMGTHGLRGFDRLMLGSVTDRVMRAASCPVLAVREPPHDLVAAGQERHNPHRLNRILACTDFSEDPHVVGGDRRALGHVRAADPHHFGGQDIAHGIRRAIDAESLLVGRTRADHAQPAVVIDIRSLQAHAGELPHEISLLNSETGARQNRERLRAMFTLNLIDSRRHALNGQVIWHGPKSSG